ncbi:MAG: NAD(FAD)-utilizing dehydrogenase, partial [Anaerovoracaceae bacterium]
MYRIHQIKLGINEDLSVIPQRIKKVTGKPDMEITQWKIVKESLDARDKGDIKKVFTVDFASNMSVNCDPAPDMRYQPIIPKHKPKQSPVIIGFGPCGIFAALILSQAGFAPIVLERGKSVEERSKDVETYWEKGILNPESNVQFGEGGAGTFSDGKLTTGIKDPRMRKVLEVLAHSGGGEEILTKQKPHIGTDVLKVVVSNIRKEIINNGGSVRFESKVSEILTENQKITGVKLADGEIIETDQVILAIGHSARDTVAMLNEKGVTIEQKPFSMGVRIQHAQEAINKAQYGKAELAKILGPADYKLSHHCKDGRGVYTFCMCPGGEIIMAASEENTIVTNG